MTKHKTVVAAASPSNASHPLVSASHEPPGPSRSEQGCC